MIFKEQKLDWNDWCNIHQDIAFFKPMIEAIFSIHKLSKPKIIQSLTPGTNAVFRVDQYVIKIFVPDQVKTWVENDYEIEKYHVLRAHQLNIDTPKLIQYGTFIKDLKWNYLIFEYIDFPEAKKVIPSMSHLERFDFVQNIKVVLSKLNQKVDDKDYLENKINKAIRNERWQDYEKSFNVERVQALNQIKNMDVYVVHGDLTAENVLINQQMKPIIIDFGDTSVAPLFYEYPPIVFDLFDRNKEMIAAFFLNKDISAISHDLLNGLLMHDFGANIIEQGILKHLNINKSELDSLETLKRLIIESIE